MKRIISIVVLAMLASLSALTLTSPAQADVTGAPTPCSAVLKSGTTNKWNLSWTAPTHTGWRPVSHYIVHVNGASTSTDVHLDSWSDWLAAPTSYTWTAALPSGWTSPLTFKVKGADGTGVYGSFCSMPVTAPNTAPKVNAGADPPAVTLPNGVNLAGTASDDGLPSGSTLTTTWSKNSGPGNVTFSDVHSLTPTATFDTAGTYVLKLLASDGTLSSSDTVSVTVNGTVSQPFLPYSSTAWIKKSPSDSDINTSLTNSFHTYMDQYNLDKASSTEQLYPWIQGVGGTTGGWGTPYAVTTDCNTTTNPIWKFSSGATDSSGGTGKWGALKTTGFHAPSDLDTYLTGTTDSPIVIRDMCAADNPYGTGSFTIWASKANADKVNHIIDLNAGAVAGAYGAFVHASNGLDNRASSDPVDANNGRSRGVIPDTMVIRKDMMDYAIAQNSDLGHALELFIVKTNGTQTGEFPNCFVFPMVQGEKCGDPTQDGWGSEGTRLVLNRTETDSWLAANRTCSAEAMVIARTLRNYGFYIGDNAGSASTLKAENESTAHPVWGGALSKDELNGCINWDDFQVINPGTQ